MLDEFGYTEMWQKDRSADAAGRLENLKELIRSMEEFENLQGFLEHISLVMDNEKAADADAVSIMTLHCRQGAGVRHRVPARLGGRPVSATSARSTTRAAPGWKRSAASPMSASRARAGGRRSISPPTGACTALWQTNIPSRFLDELPEDNVEVTESQGGFGGYGGYGASRFDAMTSFGSNYSTPGWQRAQRKARPRRLLRRRRRHVLRAGSRSADSEDCVSPPP